MRLILWRLQINVLAQKLSGEVRGGQNWCVKKKKKRIKNNTLLKRNVCQHLAAPKTFKRHPFYISLTQIIVVLVQKGCLPVFDWILAKTWQTSPPGKMVTNIPPPKSGGLSSFLQVGYLQTSYLRIWICKCFLGTRAFRTKPGGASLFLPIREEPRPRYLGASKT